VTKTRSTPAGLEFDRLAQFIQANVDGLGDGQPLNAALIPGGRSNLTYTVSSGARTWVLRRQPLGRVLPTAHDMAREYRVLAALAQTPVPVPRPIAYCADPAVIGSPFYLMERVEGTVIRSAAEASAISAEHARALALHLVDVLAGLHAVDYRSVGLADFGRPVGYLQRQLERWDAQWRQSKTRDLPALDEVARALGRACPMAHGASVVHGDYRLDNTILEAGGEPRIGAVVDWEMSTLGDPLSDVGFLLMNWGPSGPLFEGESCDRRVGFPSRDAMARAYERASGRRLDDLDFYVVLALYKVAVIFEGIHARHVAGLTVGGGFESAGERVLELSEAAHELASASSITTLRPKRAAKARGT